MDQFSRKILLYSVLPASGLFNLIEPATTINNRRMPTAPVIFADISFKACWIRIKINAGPSGREVISLQKVDSLLIFLNVMQGAKKVFVTYGQRDSREKPSEFRLNESTNRMKTRVQLFYTYPH